MRDDDVERFVAELHDASPFEVATTAVDGWSTRDTRPEDVERWIGEALEHCLARYLAFPNDPPFGAAVIEDRSRGRVYEQSPCETGQWFLERLRREARPTTEPWVFVLVPQVLDVDVRMWQTWAPGCEPRPFGLTWYFEARGRGRAARLSGSVHLTDRDALLRSWDFVDPPRAFDGILRGHPARRRHRISS